MAHPGQQCAERHVTPPLVEYGTLSQRSHSMLSLLGWSKDNAVMRW
jgi:hypothetical protein